MREGAGTAGRDDLAGPAGAALEVAVPMAVGIARRVGFSSGLSACSQLVGPIRGRSGQQLRRRLSSDSSVPQSADVVICGAGIAGCSAAYHLTRLGVNNVVVISSHTPLTLTSAYSTECYRDYWPTDTMSKFIGRSIDLIEELATETDNAFDMTRRGYLYLTANEETFASMASTAQLLADTNAVPRCTTHTDGSTYVRSPGGSLNMAQLAATTGNSGVPGAAEEAMEPLKGIDLLAGRQAVQDVFPYVDDKVVGALHARRAGWVSAQQMGVTMMNKAKEAGVTFVSGVVTSVTSEGGKVSSVQWSPAPPVDGKPGLNRDPSPESCEILTGHFVNAAGPMLNEVHSLIPGNDQTVPGVAALAHNDLSVCERRVPLRNHLHVKVIFRDTEGAVPRDAPMMIWADPQDIGADFRSGEGDEVDREWLTEAMGEMTANKLLGEASPGVHLRPYGPDTLLLLWEFWHGDWAVDDRAPNLVPEFDVEMFPEVCIRGLSTMVPSLGDYIGSIPRSTLVDGGYYTETPELLPLIGPVGGTPMEGAWMCGGLAGYGIMAGPGAGELIAQHIVGAQLPSYAVDFLPSRYSDEEFVSKMEAMMNSDDGAI